MQIVLASNNSGKLKEIQAIMAPLDVELKLQREFDVDDADETGLTFIENAILKARHACQQTGLAALADDSGLCVSALQGAPGIYSARYAGEHGNHRANIEKLLSDLQDAPSEKRQAHFICCLALLRHADDPDPLIATGKWHGEILTSPQGDGGFGYDPIFFVPDHQCSAAELDSTIKNTISHRALALQQLMTLLNSEENKLCTKS
ncbi:MAG: RdgB/HAM1 family non-canonical purine NTP pyrophosphatase [Coxiellaceae bacterium]|nr:RdgB/HAM1 family non-canonical purine NTP pyrophosphatase [Coxiellaceae bacterium]